MEVEPANLAQITRSRDGRMIAIDDDVANVARDLRDIDPGLRLRYSEAGEYFVVYYRPAGEPLSEDGGNGHLVLTAQECDQRIVERIREIAQPGYDYVDAMEKLEARKRKEAEDRFTEALGDTYERVGHAMRKELGYDKGRIYLPGEAAA